MLTEWRNKIPRPAWYTKWRRAMSAPSAVADEPAARVQAPDTSVLDQYVRSKPSAQNALDLFEHSWTSQLPPELGLRAGPLPTFDDTRIKAVLAHIGSIEGFRVLELGPLEGGHTYMLHQAGASITAIEASSRSFLKCLVVKEILGLDRAHFELGDFVEHLQEATDRYDMVLASGVLYHMLDPVGLLERLAGCSDRLVIWTHYWDADAVAGSEVVARLFLAEPVEFEWRGHTMTLHRRDYREALGWTGFCGGPETSANWLERADMMTVLGELGFDDITVLEEDVGQMNGPGILLYAQRRTGA